MFAIIATDSLFDAVSKGGIWMHHGYGVALDTYFRTCKLVYYFSKEGLIKVKIYPTLKSI